MVTGLRSALVRIVLACAAMTAHAVFVDAPALADDGGGGGGGGSGGSGGSPGAGGGGGDGWNPFGRSRGIGRGRRCVCFSPGCTCRGRTARRSRPPVFVERPARPARAVPVERTPRRQPEIVVAGLTDEGLTRLQGSGYTLVAQRNIALLGTTLHRLKAPARYSDARALRAATDLVPGTVMTRNDLFRRPERVRYRPAGTACGTSCETFELTRWSATLKQCSSKVRIGVVDTGVDVTHPALARARITVRSLRSEDRKASGLEHGTGVVSMLVGAHESEVAGLVPGAEVFSADAFHHNDRDGAADAFDLIAALDWLAGEKVRIINLSLSGPSNALLEQAVKRLQAAGHVLIAASGRPDPSGKTGYPARYADVIAVSAVDLRLRASRLSTRGEHIAFAAPGVGLNVAKPKGGTQRVEGTSFAAPFVSAAAALLATRQKSGAEIKQMLSTEARDLGAPGRDPIFGYGLVQYPADPDCRG